MSFGKSGAAPATVITEVRARYLPDQHTSCGAEGSHRMRSMPVAESATPCHASPVPRSECRISGRNTSRRGITMFNAHRTHDGARHSATHAHARNNPGEITTPAAPARERSMPPSTAVSVKAHSRFSGATASRLSRPRTGFRRSTALLVSADTNSAVDRRKPVRGRDRRDAVAPLNRECALTLTAVDGGIDRSRAGAAGVVISPGLLRA